MSARRPLALAAMTDNFRTARPSHVIRSRDRHVCDEYLLCSQRVDNRLPHSVRRNL